MGGVLVDSNAQLDSVTHLIQTALTPVFLLSGIGTLINVFNTRLSRVSDHYAQLHTLLLSADAADVSNIRRHLTRMSRRRLVLDAAIALAACAGSTTCGAAFALFLVTLKDANGGAVLVWLFGASLCFVVAALVVFMADTVFAWHGLRIDGPPPKSPA